jgi:hypothetical protein
MLQVLGFASRKAAEEYMLASRVLMIFCEDESLGMLQVLGFASRKAAEEYMMANPRAL